MMIVFGDDPQLNRAFAGWLEEKLNLRRPIREPYRAAGIFDGSELIAALVFENYRSADGTVEIGGAATTPKWMSRTIMREMAEYVFGNLRCQMAVFRVPERNSHVVDMLKRVGMEFIQIPRLRGRNESEYFFLMTDDGWDQNRLNRKEVYPNGC
jgi:RimJ/RimL family protein N-acetyltransferase